MDSPQCGTLDSLASAAALSANVDATEEYFCSEIPPWIAANSHLAGKEIAEASVSEEVRLRLRAHLLAERDFTSAFQWAGCLSNNDERISALSSVLYEGALGDPEEVLELANAVDLGTRRAAVIRAIVLRWSAVDYDAASAWLKESARR